MNDCQAASNTTFSMSSQQWELYNQIKAFEIDQLNATLPFSKRLARENCWSLNYTHRVIEEYKKFLFLAIVSDHPVTPSDAIDQAWHLHLTYTHSYWNALCAQVLKEPLHHHPTQGGAQQREQFWNCYCQTLKSYERFFGDRAPDQIWEKPTVRFQQAGQFKRVNAQRYWLIPKTFLQQFHQASWKMAYCIKRSFIIMALLIFSFSFSGSPAIAQLSLQLQQPFSSHLILQAIPSLTLEVIQKFIILHPWMTLWVGLSVASFLIAIGLSFLPAFVRPTAVVEKPEHDSIVWEALLISSISTSVLLMLHLKTTFFERLFWGFWTFWVVYFAYGILIVLFTSTRAKGRSLRPIHCKKCRQKLNKLNSANFLTEQEQVALEIGSIHFEAWHCQSCHPKVNRGSILLHRYVALSDRFKRCENCKEVTMTKTLSQIFQPETTSPEKFRVEVYTCQCCRVKEERVTNLPSANDGDFGCAGCM